MGILYKQFALTIAVSVLISAFVALSLTPALCASLLKPPKQNRKNFLDRFWDTFNDGFDRMVEIYGAILQKMGHAIAAPILVLIVITVAAFGIFFKLPAAFLPQEDNSFFITAFSLPEGSVNVRTNAAITEYLDYMGKDPAIEQSQGVTGFDILSSGQKPNAGLSFIKLKPWDERKAPTNRSMPLWAKPWHMGHYIRRYL